MSYRNRNSRIYIGRVSRKTSLKDLEYIFGKYGRILDIDIKHDYAFIEYENSRDAQYSIKQMDGRILDGSRLKVELAGKRSRNDNRTRKGPGPNDVCFSCKKTGHWANECKDSNDTDRCFRCKERGHLKRNCKLSRTPSPDRGRSRSPHSPRKSPAEKNESRSNSRKASPTAPRNNSRSPKESPKPVKNSPSPRQENQITENQQSPKSEPKVQQTLE